MSDSAYIEANVERFMGYADLYDRYRPAVPASIVDLLTQFASIPRPRRVVDLGSGTGLSTRIWADRADEVIGIEPSSNMRSVAESRSAGLPAVRYQKGMSTATGLPDGCADIITAVQSLHWMEPTGTFAEIARLLRPGGVFAAIDNDWPPTFNWELEALDEAFMVNVGKLATEGDHERDVKKWRKDQHLDRIQASGHFRYTKETGVHHTEPGDAERVVGIALSQGSVQNLLKRGITEAQLGVPEFRAAADRILGGRTIPWYFSYRIRLAVK